MVLSRQPTKGYKLPKLRIATFWFSTALCVLTLIGLGYVILFLNITENIWPKIGGIGMMGFLGFIWIGMSYAFLINNDKCANCGISIKDDYRYCPRCDLQKQIEFQNTKETLCCLVCNAEIKSFDTFEEHYVKNHENQPVAEGIFQPCFSKIRTTDTLYIKKK